MKPNGSFFTGYDWSPEDTSFNKIRQKWRDIVKSYGYNANQPGVLDFKEILKALTDSGATMEEWEAASWTRDRTPDYYIDAFAANYYSSTWQIPPEIMPQCIADLRFWATAEFGSLDQVISVPHKFIWQRFRW